MAPHSSTLAWKIPWTEEPGGLQSMGLLRVGHGWAAFTLAFHFHALEKEMATHSSVLAWRIPGIGEPGGLPSEVSQSRTRLERLSSSIRKGFPVTWLVKNLLANAGDTRDMGRKDSPGEGNGNPLQYSCLENSQGACQATVRGGHRKLYTTEQAHSPQ